VVGLSIIISDAQAIRTSVLFFTHRQGWAMLSLATFTSLRVKLTQMPKNIRRRSPNLWGQSKLFPNHGHQLMAAQFAKYEYAQQCMREGYYVEGPDEREVVYENWHILEHLFPLPTMPDWPEGRDRSEPIPFSESDHVLMEKIDEARHQYGLADVCDRLSEIKNVYDVICRSVDREVIRSKIINKSLAERPPGIPTPDLLSPEEFETIREMVSDSTTWRGLDDDGEELSHWEVLLQAQSEINRTGELSDESRDSLESVLDLRSGLKRPRLYAPTVLILLLAELYEEINKFGRKAALDADRRQVSKKEYMSERECYGDMSKRKWKCRYPSPFGQFLTDLLGGEELQELGKASIEKTLKNRKKLNGKRVSDCLRSSSDKHGFSELMQMVDLVKP